MRMNLCTLKYFLSFYFTTSCWQKSLIIPSKIKIEANWDSCITLTFIYSYINYYVSYNNNNNYLPLCGILFSFIIKFKNTRQS